MHDTTAQGRYARKVQERINRIPRIEHPPQKSQTRPVCQMYNQSWAAQKSDAIRPLHTLPVPRSWQSAQHLTHTLHSGDCTALACFLCTVRRSGTMPARCHSSRHKDGLHRSSVCIWSQIIKTTVGNDSESQISLLNVGLTTLLARSEGGYNSHRTRLLGGYMTHGTLSTVGCYLFASVPALRGVPGAWWRWLACATSVCTSLCMRSSSARNSPL